MCSCVEIDLISLGTGTTGGEDRESSKRVCHLHLSFASYLSLFTLLCNLLFLYLLLSQYIGHWSIECSVNLTYSPISLSVSPARSAHHWHVWVHDPHTYTALPHLLMVFLPSLWNSVQAVASIIPPQCLQKLPESMK